jgi:hypothetical protein
VECLRKLSASKGSRNALKRLDYDTIKLLRMDFLPPVFNSDLVFELLPIGNPSMDSQVKLMVGMNKQHDRQALTKTITSHIKDDMSLTFCSSSFIGHFRCDN